MRFVYTALCPRRHLPRFYQEQVGGLSLLRMELPNDRPRTLRRAAAAAERWGAAWSLDARLEPHLPAVSTRELWQAHAAQLALLALKGRNIPAERAVVGISALRVSRQVLETAERLSDSVRAIALDVPERESLTLHLQQRNGVSVLEGRGDVNLCFCPQPEEDCLNLGVRRPEIPGCTFSCPAVEVPEGCDRIGLASVLWQCTMHNAQRTIPPEQTGEIQQGRSPHQPFELIVD